MDKATIKRLVQQYAGPPDHLADFIADSIWTDDQIRRDYRAWAIEQHELEIRHTDEIDKHKRKLAAIQKRCPHYEDHYYPDASGGSDSCVICESCHREK